MIKEYEAYDEEKEAIVDNRFCSCELCDMGEDEEANCLFCGKPLGE